ncbi:sensor domain-containing protein [Streptomyces sp. RG38]|uniref:histidine kinase n=2 Tax=Streptomyces tagetis TaxID=2820809 RepID=A0A940XM28_9ACTN|nr:sensor domain-containing protein [Streptomyces sp. RG38]
MKRRALSGGAAARAADREVLVARPVRRARKAVAELVGGLRTAFGSVLVLCLLMLAVVTVPLGLGPAAGRGVLHLLHGLARAERRRLSRLGTFLREPDPPPTRLRSAPADATTRREVAWLLWNASGGLLLGLLGLWLPVAAVRDLLFPLLWLVLPDGATSTSLGLGTAHTWVDAVAVVPLGVGWAVIVLGLTPGMARLQARPARRLLTADPHADLSLRVAELTATRAAALDAHAAELRRIERSLHDGTQNRMVGVAVLIGAARRMLARDAEGADEVLERAQAAAEQALAELRAVSRSILPPVLADRGLTGALSGLGANCPVPCRIEADVPQRCAASVEATAYFVVAEALTNVAKHSGAHRVSVVVRARHGWLRLRVEDDGRGGADAAAGSGLAGVRDRVAAHDGTLTLSSPPGGPTVLEVVLPCGS